MFFKSEQECKEMAQRLGFDREGLARAEARLPCPGCIRVFIEDDRARSFWIATELTSFLGAFATCLVWVTEYGVWPSSENRHLYYRLRSSYGDLRELHDAPGHHYYGHEIHDLITLIDLMIQFGWGGHVLASSSSLYFSHEGWVRVFSQLEREKILHGLELGQLKYEAE
jgi:hypothetical protein